GDARAVHAAAANDDAGDMDAAGLHRAQRRDAGCAAQPVAMHAAESRGFRARSNQAHRQRRRRDHFARPAVERHLAKSHGRTARLAVDQLRPQSDSSARLGHRESSARRARTCNPETPPTARSGIRQLPRPRPVEALLATRSYRRAGRGSTTANCSGKVSSIASNSTSFSRLPVTAICPDCKADSKVVVRIEISSSVARLNVTVASASSACESSTYVSALFSRLSTYFCMVSVKRQLSTIVLPAALSPFSRTPIKSKYISSGSDRTMSGDVPDPRPRFGTPLSNSDAPCRYALRAVADSDW